MISEHDAMTIALDEALRAADAGDVPVGAVVMVHGEVIAVAHNEKEAGHDPTAHAELLAIRRAAQATGSWRLNGATLVVTLEPCIMCAGAIVAARMDRVVFGAYDRKAGATGSLYNVCADPRLNHQTQLEGGMRKDECSEILLRFFSERRTPDSGELS
jgi:tRNA(adenine34) deaminase